MRFEGLDLNLLVALDALLEECSVSTAAKRLCLSQPAVSGALNRLREFFEDDLLVQSGRQMILTPKAEELRGPVREALLLIKSTITTPTDFDPATAERRFTIVASDYVYNILIGSVLAKASRVAPHVSFDLEHTSRKATERLARGEVDLYLSLTEYMLPNHPRIPLFADDHVVIACANGDHREGLSAEAFCSAPHAVVSFGSERLPAFTEQYFSDRKISRNINVRVPTFAALPQAVVGSNRLATLYRRHAHFFAEHLPIAIHEPPFSMPPIQEDIQWHETRSNDLGLSWLIRLIREQVIELGLTIPDKNKVD